MHFPLKTAILSIAVAAIPHANAQIASLPNCAVSQTLSVLLPRSARNFQLTISFLSPAVSNNNRHLQQRLHSRQHQLSLLRHLFPHHHPISSEILLQRCRLPNHRQLRRHLMQIRRRHLARESSRRRSSCEQQQQLKSAECGPSGGAE